MKRKPKTGKKALEAKADKLWSQYILLRDKETCQRCGRPGNNPHHIFTRSIKHLRHDPRNGMCLCPGCHTLSRESAHKGPEFFRDFLIKKMGSEFERLKISAGMVIKPDYSMAIIALEKLLEEM